MTSVQYEGMSKTCDIYKQNKQYTSLNDLSLTMGMRRDYVHFIQSIISVFLANPSNRIPVWYYDKVRHRWTPQDSTMFHPRKPFTSDSLRIITYNIWFKKTHQPSRFNHLNALLRQSNAHIICLQESEQVQFT